MIEIVLEPLSKDLAYLTARCLPLYTFPLTLQKLSRMDRAEKVAFRESHKAARNAEKRRKKEAEAETIKVKAAEKEHKKKMKADLKALALDNYNEKQAEKKLKEKLKRGNMSEKEKDMAKLLARGAKKVNQRNKLTQKYGAGKLTGQGNEDMAKRSKVEKVIPAIPGQATRTTAGVVNIVGVYKWNAERGEENQKRQEYQKEMEDRKAAVKEAEIVSRAKERREAKEKKRRMKKNGGIDPEDVVPSKAQLMREKRKELRPTNVYDDDFADYGSSSDDGYKSGGVDDVDDDDGDNDDDDDDDDVSVSSDIIKGDSGEGGLRGLEQESMDANLEGELMAQEFKRQTSETKQMLKRMGYSLSTKRCASCGGKSPDRPIDYWTGLPKGGSANQWYAVGDQHFCYPCANNGVLMKGVAKALAIMNGLDASEGVKNWNKVKNMKFRLNYNLDESHEENKKNFVEEVVVKGPNIREMNEKKRAKQLRRQLRERRLERGKQMKRPSKTQWWQKKRRQEEDIWHADDIEKVSRKIRHDPRFNPNLLRDADVDVAQPNVGSNGGKKNPKIMGADWDAYKTWFPQDGYRHMPR